MTSTLTNDRAVDAANLMAAIADEFSYACLLLILGERKAYEHFCRELIWRPGQLEDPYAAVIMARVCAVGASDAVESETLIDWAIAGVEQLCDAARSHVLGLTYYRAGQFGVAIEKLQQSNAAQGWSPQAKSQNWLVMAMARHRLGDVEEARHCLAKARVLIADVRAKMSNEETSLADPDWIELNVLLREAEALIDAGTLRSEAVI